MVNRDEFQHESIQDNQTISQYLKALMEGFEKEQILFDTSKNKLC